MLAFVAHYPTVVSTAISAGITTLYHLIFHAKKTN
jgi:hypothetical protein